MHVTYDEYLRLLEEAVFWRLEYLDSNPDIGMGPLVKDVVKEMCERLNISLDDETSKYIVTRLYERRCP